MTGSDDDDKRWIVTIRKDGTMTVAMSPEQAEEIVCRAAETGQSLPVYIRHCLGFAEGPTPELVEFHSERGTYSPMFDRMAELGYPLVTLSVGRIDGNPDKIVLAVTIDETGATVTLAEKDVPFLETLYNADIKTFRLRKARKRRKNEPPSYRFPDTDAGHA